MNTVIIKKIILGAFILLVQFFLPSFANNNSIYDLETQKSSNGLIKDCFKGEKYSINSYTFDWEKDSNFLKRVEKKYPYLKKAFDVKGKENSLNTKYIFIYDKILDKKEFDLIKIAIPQGAKTLEIIQISDPFEEGSFTNELFLFPKVSSKKYKRAAMKNLLNEFYESNGIVRKSVDIDSLNYSYAVYAVTNYSMKKIYALLFEFTF